MADQTPHDLPRNRNPQDVPPKPDRPSRADADDRRRSPVAHRDDAGIETGAFGNANAFGMAGIDKLNAYIPAESSFPFTPGDEEEETPPRETRPNLDPLSGAAGAHPLGAGAGAAGGGLIAGAATGFAIGSVVGPAGQALGAAAGAIIGGLAGGFAGKGIAESIHPTAGQRARKNPG